MEHEVGHEKLMNSYIGNELMKNVETKNYLGSMISTDLSNKINIKEKTNIAVGIVNKIQTTFEERPYGKYYF